MHQPKRKLLGEFILEYNMYHSSSVCNRRTIWEENLAKIRQHNLEHDIGLRTFTMEMNRFGDMVCIRI